MLEQLKQEVCAANLKLVAQGLVIQTWGNVSGVDRAGGHLVIKPSGVPYSDMKAEQMVVLCLQSGAVVEGDLRPSSDAPTHLILARAFPHIGGIVHTHSLYATAWAQAKCDLPALGTTHADYFYGAVPCTRVLTPPEIAEDYEANTGHVIIERFLELDASHFPGVLVASHAPFSWGETPDKAVENAVVLENVAHLASETLHIRADIQTMQQELLDKHFTRKHGPGAYYGQK
ncbi:L-ribulose-5-phosphate 4-epimerase AraD [Abditibacterium utsteinense]|nr:L-ribulose-5-phosphate 4-epimerase AraD [Abditibacterium utsteinense]